MLNRIPRQLPPLALLLDDLGAPSNDAIGRALGVDPRTVRRWKREDHAPRMAVASLFWLTRWGMSVVHTEAVNAATLHAEMTVSLRRKVQQLETRIARLASIGEFGCANDPTSPFYPVSALRLIP